MIQTTWERKKILTIAVCDDNSTDRTQIIQAMEAYFQDRGVDGKVFSYDSAEKLNSEMESNRLGFDIVFLDIIMNDMDGMTCARLIRRQDKLVKIIFLTSSTDHVYEGYEVGATAYLVKPVAAEKLAAVLGTAIDAVEDIAKESITFTAGGVTQRILLKDIVYLESKKNKVIIMLARGESLAVYTTMDEFEQAHRPTMWIRSHKSYVVNFLYIERYLSDKFVLRDGIEIPISRVYKDKARECFFNLLHNQ
ncbi:MAG: LytTR family DNA-binding domain-containing protein [Negativicutes bacterium]|nr:LytTR family DNA-binding domain-containing protein [Negativicutes bacterium]